MGEFLALLTAALWAVGVILFKKAMGLVGPVALNLFKNCVAFVLLGITALVLGQFQAASTLSIPPKHLVILLTSGALGIGVSDTLLFMTLRRLGASRTALVDCLYSPFVILFSFFMLQETLTPLAGLGGVLIIGSVALTSQRSFGGGITRKQFWIGCALGASAMATVAFAIVLVKPLLNMYPLSVISTVRMAGGIAALIPLLAVHPDRKSMNAILRPNPAWKWMFLGAFFGSYVSLVCWLAGFKYSQAGVVAILNQTSTMFIVVLAALFLNEPMTRLKAAAVAMALVGALIIIY
jgi:drug/metabolite transporter (DMT)-like permease